MTHGETEKSESSVAEAFDASCPRVPSAAGAWQNCFWSVVAPHYDAFVRRGCPEYAIVLQRIIHDTGVADRVLDVGTGTGLVAFALAGTVRSVTAIDACPAMIAVAERKQDDLGVTNVDFSVQSAYALAFESATFDAAVTCNVLHVINEPFEALLEIRRVLKPGGVLIAPTYCHGATPTSLSRSWALALIGFCVRRRFRVSDLCRLIESAGLPVVTVEVVAGWIPLAYVLARKP